MIFALFGTLPLLEIAGFIIIGGRIGFGDSVLWLISDVVVGVYLLTSIGKTALVGVNEEVSPLKSMFDTICILIGALLLIFPGFVSDFIALFFIVPFLRYGVFLFLSSFYGGFLEEFTKKGETYAERYYEHKKDGSSSSVIEGEYTIVENNKTNDDLH